jgi:hypothetical protein
LVEQGTSAYRDVNERFAAVEVGRGGLRWVHDYQLMLVPSLLRRAGASPIGFFLHVPFPPPEIYARLPWREQLLEGLLGADIVSFQTEPYRENFARTCARLLKDVRVEGRTIAVSGRRVVTAAHPISIDARALAEDARSDATERSLRGLRAPQTPPIVSSVLAGLQLPVSSASSPHSFGGKSGTNGLRSIQSGISPSSCANSSGLKMKPRSVIFAKSGPAISSAPPKPI